MKQEIKEKLQNLDSLRQAKQQCVADITEALPRYADRLNQLDPRLMVYIDDALSGEGEHANLYELLGIRKQLRLMDTYQLNPRRVHAELRAIEGKWAGGKHVKGGLKFSTPRGPQHVRLMPYQVWCVAGIYGLTTEVSMERDYTPGEALLPSEFERDGKVFDRRRLCTEAHIFQTRKSGKTEFGAALVFVEVSFLGPANGQALICANNAKQTKVAYKAIKEFAMQVDPTCSNRMGGKYFRLTASEMNWQPGYKMKGEIITLAAGGKQSRDAYYASVVYADEHGSARYVNGSSDMQNLVNVCVGSMGPRREPLTIHTTTAGLISEGPYKNQLEGVERMLLDELKHPLGQPCPTSEDRWFALLLRLDPWETDYNLSQLNNPALFKKVNRAIGVTVQPTWYASRIHEAETNPDIKKEVLAKDFNIWAEGTMTRWISGDYIRPLQTTRRLIDCTAAAGWHVFGGFDFSQGDDLYAFSTLAVDYSPREQGGMSGRFFADTIAWVLEETMNESPNYQLYRHWVDQGWLRVCPGKVFDPTLAINEVARIVDCGIDIVSFGYDPAQSATPINHLKAWLQTLFLGRDPNVDPKQLAQVIEQMTVSVGQSSMVQNQLIINLEEMILSDEPWIEFSASPLWAWCFGNCATEQGRTELRRLCKGGPRPTHKIDPVAALLDALYCFNLSEARVKI